MSKPQPSSATSADAGLHAAYERDGFVVCDEVFTAAEVERLRAIVEAQAFAEAYKRSQGTVHSLSLAAAHPALRDLAADPRIVARIAPLLGPDICLQHSKLAAKPLQAGKGPFAWHQDFAYYPHSNTDLLSVMVMLDDAREDNGCMWMVPGSHRLGLLPHHDEAGFFTGGCTWHPVWEAPGAAVPVTPRAGGISIHHALTLHGSPANRSGRPRRGLVFSYRAADAQQLADSVFPDTGFVVAGRRSGSVRCTVGAVLLPRFGGDPDRPHKDAWHQVGAAAAAWNRERGLGSTGTWS
ncbi:MAG: phytanoyl-CoA dioxygenase family protein [Planctomycetes bacterium]|nr:phytanoyl-CoA dioxygenase family protein [Planctomycetota bacterium]